MNNTNSYLILLLIVTATSACTNRTMSQATTPDYNSYVHIAAIDPKMSGHVNGILSNAGIDSIIWGSRAYGVSVPPGTQSRATEILRADSSTEKYWIVFPK